MFPIFDCGTIIVSRAGVDKHCAVLTKPVSHGNIFGELNNLSKQIRVKYLALVSLTFATLMHLTESVYVRIGQV